MNHAVEAIHMHDRRQHGQPARACNAWHAKISESARMCRHVCKGTMAMNTISSRGPFSAHMIACRLMRKHSIASAYPVATCQRSAAPRIAKELVALRTGAAQRAQIRCRREHRTGSLVAGPAASQCLAALATPWTSADLDLLHCLSCGPATACSL